ncbi:MAG TPA: N-acetylmuramoyl-L-alanine amidase [Candidatus Blautia gallistercoris]|uniref:N-acetylmuramoyl-L-alanine amidase n=1 Tax=Candidatus Blautia gallistercoris TaxID=2838490 RepID=A0A9D2B3V1_9FIRM|nr:N-acetylmuramoyl-L-alanine amidase [Candidatus Blautia gallistercoris]
MKRYIELAMTAVLLACVWLLSREAAAVSNMAETKTVIVVDAGHGGVDGGMAGTDGVDEKDINLSIAWKLRDALKDSGFEVIMTREGDEGLYEEGSSQKKVQDLQNRCKIIAEASPALTVSIHQNSYTDPSVCGPQVFYYSTSQEGKRLAEVLQEVLNQALSADNGRKAKGNDSYYLLKRSEGVLNIVECGFLTNPKEAELLQEEAYQQKVADALCLGIRQYLSEEPRG